MTQSPKRRLSFGRIVVGVVFLLILAALGSCFLVNRLLFAPQITQTSGPVALQEASRDCPIPLPATAKNIQYASYRVWQAYEAFVRFEAPVPDCLSHVDALINHQRKQNAPSDELIELKPIDPACLVVHGSDRPSSMNISWFDLQRIKRGKWGGAGGSYAPRVWVDEDKGVFYYHITD